MKPQFTVILPTYDEIENVPTLIEHILNLQTEEEIKILVVDDNSPDGTALKVEALFGNNPRVKVFNRRGLARGLVNSLNHGIAMCDTEYIIWMDADLQMPAATIPELIKSILKENCTAVLGSRFIPGGSDVRDQNGKSFVVRLHKTLSKFLNQTGAMILNLPATDLTSGFLVIRKDYFRSRALQGIHGEYFIDLVNDLHHKGHKFKEIPYRLEGREKGISKSTNETLFGILKTGSPYIMVLMRLFLRKYKNLNF